MNELERETKEEPVEDINEDSDYDSDEQDEEEITTKGITTEELYDENGIDFLNIFLIYYKQLFNTKMDVNMFDQIDYTKQNSTNRCMELLCEHQQKHEECKNNDRKAIYELSLWPYAIDDCEELYQLNITGYPSLVCEYLVPLIMYLTTQEWTIVEWSIVSLKNNT
jgi:hypothetical protein